MKEKIIECPACHQSGTHKLPAMADISADPKLKASLLDGSFFEWTCPACSRRFFVDEVFLCCNTEEGYCVYLVPGYKEASLPIPTVYKSRCTGKLRVTDTYVDFAEKLRIFSAGLNDGIIEAMKAVYATVCHQTSQRKVFNMIFETVMPDGKLGFAVIFEDEELCIDLPAAAYENALTDFDSLLPNDNGDMFLKVDQQWLANVLNEDEPS